MASLLFSPISFLLPSQKRIFSFISLAPLFSQIYHKPRSVFTEACRSSRSRTRWKTQQRTGMPTALHPHAPTLRRERMDKLLVDHESGALVITSLTFVFFFQRTCHFLLYLISNFGAINKEKFIA